MQEKVENLINVRRKSKAKIGMLKEDVHEQASLFNDSLECIWTKFSIKIYSS